MEYFQAQPFKPAGWLPGPHGQTVAGSLFVPAPRIDYQREIVEFPDGDIAALDWAPGPEQGPLHLIIHGMEGSSDSRYARRMVAQSLRNGWRAAVLNMRSSGGLLNRKPTFYHAGWYQDIEYVVGEHLEMGSDPLMITGVSLGGSQLIHFLARSPYRYKVTAAMTVSTPLWLGESADYMAGGLNRLYIYKFRTSLVKKYRAKADLIRNPEIIAKLATIRNFWELDEYATAPMHGFEGAAQYYEINSSGQYLKDVECPLLLVTSRDDPFIPPSSIPDGPPADSIQILTTAKGGHVGFIQNDGKCWVDACLTDYYSTLL
jgi:hypothetical protein